MEPPDRCTRIRIHPSPDLRFVTPNCLSSSLASTALLARQLSCAPCLCREHHQHAGADCLPAGQKRERSRRTTRGAGPSREILGPVGIGAPRSSKSGEDSAASSPVGVVRACWTEDVATRESLLWIARQSAGRSAVPPRRGARKPAASTICAADVGLKSRSTGEHAPPNEHGVGLALAELHSPRNFV